MVEVNYWSQHRPYVGAETTVSPNQLAPGAVVSFSYNGKRRYVFVLKPYWEGKLHGLDLEKMPRQETMIIASFPIQNINPRIMYENYLDRPRFMKFKSYRTYNTSKMGTLRLVEYDFGASETESGDVGIEEQEGSLTTDDE